MIKIEFKEAQRQIVEGNGVISIYCKTMHFDKPCLKTRLIRKWFDDSIESITFGCPSELVPSRDHILTQLGITKEQDEANQIEWKKI